MSSESVNAERVLARCRALSQRALVQSKRYAGDWDALREELESILQGINDLKEQVWC